MNLQEFKESLSGTIEIIIADLIKLKAIAEAVNNGTTSSTTTIQTTVRPDGAYNGVLDESRCTIPTAMVCFSVLDTFGQWVIGAYDDDFSNTSSAFFDCIAQRDDLKNELARKKLKEQFRHGIMHGFFAKTGYSVSYPTFDSNSLFLDLSENNSTLDVKYLTMIVELGLQRLNKELQVDESKLIQRCFQGYLAWEKKG